MDTEQQMNQKKKPKRKLATRKNVEKYGYYFLIPFFLVFAIFNLYPTLYTIFLSFQDISGFALSGNFIGLDNFINLFNNDIFIQSVQNTAILWIINFIPQIILAMVLAYWFTNNRLKLKGQSFFKSMFYFPNIMTAASVAVIFYTLFSYPRGPVNQILLGTGVLEAPFDFFRSEMFTRGLVSFIQFWMWYGQTTLVLIAGILSIDKSLYEAATVDGATSWQSFRMITLPLIRPITLYVMITSLIGGLQMFDIPLLLTNGGPNGSVETLMTYIYKQAFQGGRNISVASAASVILLLITIVFSLLIIRYFRQRSKD